MFKALEYNDFRFFAKLSRQTRVVTQYFQQDYNIVDYNWKTTIHNYLYENIKSGTRRDWGLIENRRSSKGVENGR